MLNTVDRARSTGVAVSNGSLRIVEYILLAPNATPAKAQAAKIFLNCIANVITDQEESWRKKLGKS